VDLVTEKAFTNEIRQRQDHRPDISVLHQLDHRAMSRRIGKTAVTSSQRCRKRFRKRDVGGVVGGDVLAQIPDTRQEELMRIPDGSLCIPGWCELQAG